jgi:hypothetical protein
MSFFENEFPLIVKSLITSISQGLDGAMTSSIQNHMLDIKHGNIMDETNEAEIKKLDRNFVAHFVTQFILDLMQLISAHLITSTTHNQETLESEYDHRK